MGTLQAFVESQLANGRSYFTKPGALAETRQTPEAFQAAVARQSRKRQLVKVCRGFFLIVRPEDRRFGAPDPTRWIGPLMTHLGLDYRVSLLSAAAFHGSTHQAAMVFQVVTPRQLPNIQIGRRKVEFLFQSESRFAETNRPEWLSQLKTADGFAKMAGVELTLLDTCRYFHKAGGINGVAQAAHDLGRQADVRILSKAAAAYENSTVRRLGYLLEIYGITRQADALRKWTQKAKSFKPLDPSSKFFVPELSATAEKNSDWKLLINVSVEIDQ